MLPTRKNVSVFRILVSYPVYGGWVALCNKKQSNMSKTILITGASRGFGKIWAEAFLERGDKVVATARNIQSLKDLSDKYGSSLLPLQLDVNDRAASFAAVQKAQTHFGRIDVLINNAGYGLFGAIEETSEKEARDQFETNVFGLLWVTQAVLPIMRSQGHGHIVQISSVLGINSMPILGVYAASKFAVEGLSESLAAEVKAFGIKVTLVEPNGFSTDWGGSSAIHTQAISAYEPVKAEFFKAPAPDFYGNPDATTGAILQLVDSTEPPLRLFLGKIGLPWTKQAYAEKLSTWEKWSTVADAAHGV
jgi:NAD(P)-dependent dehydrogenase (short-subunit alcohol dehydrogenase family)